MKIKEMIELNKLRLSVNPAGSSFDPLSGVMPNITNNVNDLVLDRLSRQEKPTDNLMLTGEKVHVHIYGSNALLDQLESELKSAYGKSWEEIREMEIENVAN